MDRRPKLKRADLDRITAATAQAESRTSAEIVTVVANQSGAYTGQVLLVCLAVMTAFSALYFIFLKSVQEFLAIFLWHVRPSNLLLVFFVGQVFVFGLTFLLLSVVPDLRLLVVSNKDKKSRVRERAEVAFVRHNIGATEGSNGILIFISLLEKRVELLADALVVRKVDPNFLQDVVNGITAGIRAGAFLPSLEKEILRCGEMLAGPFPRQAGDVNELPDRPVLE